MYSRYDSLSLIVVGLSILTKGDNECVWKTVASFQSSLVSMEILLIIGKCLCQITHTQLIDALESHVTTARATLRKKLKKKGLTVSGLEPRHSSMAVEVSWNATPYCCLCVGGWRLWEPISY